MKTFLCAMILVMIGITSAFAQQTDKESGKGIREQLFPELAKDRARLQKTSESLSAKLPEASINSREALMARIFTNYKPSAPGTGNSTMTLKKQQSTIRLSSEMSSADAAKQEKKPATEQPKITVPDQTQK